jgi:hypothetical protein
VDPVSRTPTSLKDYATLSATYGTLLGSLLAASRGRPPVPQAELPALGLATFQLSKLLTKEKVESWVREPFVEEEPDGERHPKGEGLRYAVGELLTCSRCAGAWSSLALTSLRVLRPREGRIVTTVLASAAVNDWLQAGFTRLTAEADVSAARKDAAADGRFERVTI